MKQKIFTTSLFIAAFCIYGNAIPFSESMQKVIKNDEEIENVKNTIVESYVEGIFLKGDADLFSKGWHPDCDIVIFENQGITKLSAKYWIDRLKKNSKPLNPYITYNIVNVVVTGYAAIAIIDIFSNGKQLYTDYMCLYKFKDGWKIVTKTFYSFPKLSTLNESVLKEIHNNIIPVRA